VSYVRSGGVRKVENTMMDNEVSKDKEMQAPIPEKNAEAQQPEEEDFAALYEASIKDHELREGEIVKGEVIQLNPDHVVVDIGYKSEGTIPVD